jgi:hypothetical protein
MTSESTQPPSAARRIAVTLGIVVVMALLTVGGGIAIHFLIGHFAGNEAIFIAGVFATFAVACLFSRAGLASPLQCEVAALVVGVLCAALSFAIEGVWETFLVSLSYLLFSVGGRLGARIGRRSNKSVGFTKEIAIK